jgi:hypothetical protein
MPVELRLEEAGAAAPAPGVDREGSGAVGAAALRDLIAARLVTHEAIGDPARLGPEATALRALCGLVAGPVYRLEPYHYAFAARPGDLDGTLAGRDLAARTAALDAALAAALGAGAVWLGATDPPPVEPGARPGSEPTSPPMSEAGLLVLRMQDAAVEEGLAAADPGLRAVIDARLAAEAARRAADFAAALGVGTAAAAAADLDRRLAALEARLVDIRASEAREARAFEARLGLALAEFLARVERRDSAAAPVA